MRSRTKSVDYGCCVTYPRLLGRLDLAICTVVAITSSFWLVGRSAAQPAITFTDVSKLAGITLTVDQAPPQTGAGMAVIDVDKDGLPDLILSGGFKLPTTLYRNIGNLVFKEVPGAQSGLGFLGTDSRGFAAGDYDNDGDRDLFVANWASDQNSVLLRNDDGHFVNVTAASEIVINGNASGASWTDYDGDGCLDLYVSRYWWSENPLFRGNCAGKFVDVTEISGLGTPVNAKNSTQSFQSVWFDIDLDGDQDLYLMNDRCYVGMERNQLYLNNGDGTFSEAAAQFGLDFCFDAMGIGLADFDGDGLVDMFMTNTPEGHLFGHSTCSGFVEKADDLGLMMNKWGWAVLTDDFNLDGWPDLFVVNAGYNNPETGGNLIFVNKGDGTLAFDDMTAWTNSGGPIGNTGLVRADFDADGDLDVVVGKVLQQPLAVLRNDSVAGNYISLRLQGVTSNRDGIGATVDVIAGGRLRRQLRFESSVYNGSNDDTLVFGLGKVSKITGVSILWPSGTVQWIETPMVNQVLTVVETPSPGSQTTVGAELCGDAHDNDCDGTVDAEYSTVGQPCTVGNGVCANQSVLACTNDLLGVMCAAEPGIPEGEEVVGDGVDNDCDGEVDEFVVIEEVESRPRREDPVLDPWSPCTANIEVCGDLEDNDCDGLVDEGFGIGLECEVLVGACLMIGVTLCSDSGLSTVCNVANVEMGPELCGDGKDNDCDGEIDEGFDIGTACSVQVHGCSLRGVWTCQDSGVVMECLTSPDEEKFVELCGDGIDNDCDGEVDEGFQTGDWCAAYVNNCIVAGTMQCADDQLSEFCDIRGFVPPVELCGDRIDNDCNGLVDDGYAIVGTKCWVGSGVCRRKGLWTCGIDLQSIFCDATPGVGSPEIIGDGLDNDCDGVVDLPTVPESETVGGTWSSAAVFVDNLGLATSQESDVGAEVSPENTAGCRTSGADEQVIGWFPIGGILVCLFVGYIRKRLNGDFFSGTGSFWSCLFYGTPR